MGLFGIRSEDHLPGFDGATGWLNSEPLTVADLRGKVVLVDFWTYTCINWLRTLGYVRAWADKYEDTGLVVVGVHTPEFPFERDVDNIRPAVKDMDVRYPVAIDSDYGVWRAFDNHYWPAVYIADAEGRIRHHHFGEGAYDECERVVQELLREAGAEGIADDLVAVAPDGLRGAGRLGQPAVARDLPRLRAGAELRIATSPRRRVAAYAMPARWAQPVGARRGLDDRASGRSCSNRADGRIAFRFHARDVHLVMGPAERGATVPFRVLVDGEPPGDAHGLDVDEAGSRNARPSSGSISSSASRDRSRTARSRSRSEPRASRPTASRSARGGNAMRSWARMLVASVAGALVLAGCGSDEAPRTTASPAAALEGTWKTVRSPRARPKRRCDGTAWANGSSSSGRSRPSRTRSSSPWTSTTGNGTLYGQPSGGASEEIDYNAEYVVKGDTVDKTHSTGTTTLGWTVDGDTLKLEWLETNEPPVEGIPDEVFQRALYMTQDFERQS